MRNLQQQQELAGICCSCTLGFEALPASAQRDDSYRLSGGATFRHVPTCSMWAEVKAAGRLWCLNHVVG